MSRGIEITVYMDRELISSRWFRAPVTVGVGDSHLFDVFCPLTAVDGERDAKLDKRAQGFVLLPVRGVHSVGAELFSWTSDGRARLSLPAGVRGHLGDEVLEPASQPGTRELPFPCAGEIQADGPWRLRFSVHEAPPVGALANLPRPGYFSLALLYGAVLLAGLLWLGFLDPGEFTWEELVPGTRHRMAVLQAAPQKRPPRPVVEEPVAERLSNLRVAPRRRTQVAPRPRAPRQSQLLRATAAKNQVRLTHTEHVIDLTDPDAPAEESDGPPELDGPGNVVPVVPVAPPPQVNVPPPPMVAPEPPPKVATPPRRLSFPQVDYPDSARHLGVEGRVRLLLHIDREGNVYKVEVLTGLHPTLDRAAIAGAKAARYEPAMDTRGRPIVSTATVTVRFELEEE
jgi:TonB family protein